MAFIIYWIPLHFWWKVIRLITLAPRFAARVVTVKVGFESINASLG